MRIYLSILFLLCIINTESQTFGTQKSTEKIIFDTDMGSDCDDVGALALLHYYDISSLTGAELVEKKVKRWVALGALNANNKERHFTKDWNLFFNETAPYSKYLVENFPRPVFYIDGGSKVFTGKSLKNTPPGNIVRTAYRDWLWYVEKKTLDDQRPSWDLVTVNFAIEGLGEFLESSGNGWLDFDVEKGCRWNSGESHLTQTFIQQKEGTNERFADYLNKLIAESPANRSINRY